MAGAIDGAIAGSMAGAIAGAIAGSVLVLVLALLWRSKKGRANTQQQMYEQARLDNTPAAGTGMWE